MSSKAREHIRKQQKVFQSAPDSFFPSYPSPDSSVPPLIEGYVGHDFSRIPLHYNDKQESRSSLQSSENSSKDYEVVHEHIPFFATVRRVNARPSTKKEIDREQLSQSNRIPLFQYDVGEGKDSDAEPGNDQGAEIDSNAIISDGVATASATTVPDVEEGTTIHVPDIVISDSLVEEETDSIASGLTYSTTVTQSGTVSPFGATTWNRFNLTGITITPAAGAFTVRATLENPLTFNVASGGRTNIASAGEPALTSANYATAASDLTPNMSDLNGRPPRTKFWAEDLTIVHERFHVTERQGFARSGLASAQSWLNLQSASSAADVNTLLGQVPGRVVAASQAAMPFPAKEERAYGAGAPAYKARADAINTKGNSGGYP